MQIGSIQSGSLIPSNLASKATAASSAPKASTPAKASPFAYYDPADTNQDGVVSAMEQLAYDLKHPSAAAASKAATVAAYTPKGALQAGGGGLFDFRI